jgi:predicted alpha-1,6-mannanase (GH76 family)
LFKITGETLYLRDAVRASSYTLSSLSDLTESVLKDEGTGDGGLFKGIFVRYFTLLIQEPQLDASDKTRFVAYLKHNAEVLKEKGLQAQYLIGSNWARNTSAIDLGTHVSGCVLLEAVALDTL